MYVKVFESIDSSRSYTLHYKIGLIVDGDDGFCIEDENHCLIDVEAKALFKLIDGFFKDAIKMKDKPKMGMSKKPMKKEEKMMDEKIKMSEKKDVKQDAKMMKEKMKKKRG